MMAGVEKLSALRRARLAKVVVWRTVRSVIGVHMGDVRLPLAVLQQAIEDLAHPAYRDEAVRYVRSGFMDHHAGLVGLDGDAIRLLLRQAGLIDADAGDSSGERAVA